MYTEDEAKQKWCPKARVADYNAADKNSPVLAATNRHAGVKTGKDGKPRILRKNAMCIASQCMAWRWGRLTRLGTDRVIDPRQGYCGAFGKPEHD